MRISDWSSDVCSSDLAIGLARIDAAAAIGDAADDRHAVAELVAFDRYRRLGDIALRPAGIGRARAVERIAGLRRHDDLGEIGEEQRSRGGDAGQGDGKLAAIRPDQSVDAAAVDPYGLGAIRRAPSRERGCQYGESSVVGGSIK